MVERLGIIRNVWVQVPKNEKNFGCPSLVQLNGHRLPLLWSLITFVFYFFIRCFFLLYDIWGYKLIYFLDMTIYGFMHYWNLKSYFFLIFDFTYAGLLWVHFLSLPVRSCSLLFVCRMIRFSGNWSMSWILAVWLVSGINFKKPAGNFQITFKTSKRAANLTLKYLMCLWLLWEWNGWNGHPKRSIQWVVKWPSRSKIK